MSGLPKMINGDGIRKRTQVKFGGYDHWEGAGDGTFWDMKNLCGDHYPLISTRAPRCRLRNLSQPWGLWAHDGLYWVDGEGFYAKGERKGEVAPGEKNFASLGAYVLIFPDKKYYHTLTGEFGSLEAQWTGAVSFQDGTYAGQPAVGNTIVIPSQAEGEFPFHVGDGVTISGCGEEDNNKTAVIEEISEDRRELRFLENAFTPWTGKITLKREVPDLDFLCVNENRVWGCKGDTIYTSKLGDPFNWNVMYGLSTDSFAVDVGSAGDFTACCSYLGYPVFFKEDHIYKVYGNKPSNFQVMASASLGVEKGSHKSLAIAGERLFYLSRAGVMCYGGGSPEPVGHALGPGRARNAVAGSDGQKYTISLENEAGEHSLFTYDTRSGLWHREDETEAIDFAWDGGLYCLDRTGDLWLSGTPGEVPEGASFEENMESFGEFGDFTENGPDKKGLTRIQLRAQLEAGASLTVRVKYDSEEEWRTVSTLAAERKRSFVIPLIPRRCDHWRLRLEGRGAWTLHSLSREYYAGSEI